MKKILTKIILLILGTMLALLLGEIILRSRGVLSLGYHQYDSQAGLVILPPNSQFYQPIDSGREPVLIKANSQGFRDSEFNLQKPEDVFRIAVFGDSYVEARQVPLEKSFHYLLEQKLNELAESQKKFEVYSFGIGGIGTFRNYLYLNQYALKYQPDLVILAFLPANDFRDDYETISEIFDEEGKIKKELSKREKISTKSVLILWFNYKWQIIKRHQIGNFFRKIFFAKNSPAQVPFDFQVFLKDYPQSWFKIWDLEKKLLLQFKETVQENQGKFLLLSLSDLWRTHPELLERDENFGQYFQQFEFDFDKPEKILADFSQTEKIPYLNLTPIFRERARREKKIVFFYDNNFSGHWNEEGNLWAAEIIFQFLTQNQELLR